MENRAPAERPILDVLARRRSSRAIDPARAVPREALLTLLEAARWAPSSFNEQPWRFLVFDGSDAQALEAARDCLSRGNVWAKAAPVLVLSVASERLARDGSPNRHGQHDTGGALQYLLLQATELGLVAHAMAGFDAARARDQFGIPEGFTPMAMIAVGWPGDPESLAEGLREREKGPRRRRPLAETAFAGGWGRPF